MSAREAVVTGLGAVGAFGVGLDALAAGVSGRAAPQSRRYEVVGGALTVGEARFKLREHWPEAPPRLGRMDRGSRMFLLAGHEALLGAGLPGVAIDGTALDGTAVVLGTRFGCLLINEAYHRGLITKGVRLASPLLFGYTVPSAPAGELSIAAGLTGPNLTVVSGDASGGIALARAAAWVRSGRVERAVAGGCDPQGAWLAQELWDQGVRDGAGPLPAEGAGVAVIEDAAAAERRGARILARLGHASDGFCGWNQAMADPLAHRIGRTYAASAPLALAAAAIGAVSVNPIEVRDEEGYWVTLDWTPGPSARSHGDDGSTAS